MWMMPLHLNKKKDYDIMMMMMTQSMKLDEGSDQQDSCMHIFKE